MTITYHSNARCAFNSDVVKNQIERLKMIADAAASLNDILAIDLEISIAPINRNQIILFIDRLIKKYPELITIAVITNVHVIIIPDVSDPAYNEKINYINSKSDIELTNDLIYIRNCIPIIALSRYVQNELLSTNVKKAINLFEGKNECKNISGVSNNN